ncbi:cohesin-associated protein Pds5 [Coprinopsis marcescibilis]|uniref:Cohesin-associated protein Pds5 n=1 Tax=Coprinopsis marcescibilis TaxID=230819 RepID=A0A5C3KKC5_COPMA|nr:cohesin-associated protein Pds5 [Coprinopsis marcescibilis]
MVAQTRHGGQTSPKRKLEFREKLVGKGLSTDALLKKMKTLHDQLAGLDQEHVDVTSLGTARKELIHTNILLHKDRGVKAYAACCLADILRLYAPDAPYTQPELRDIFQFFFRQLSAGLKGSEATYYNEYFHLLESLSTVKSVVLVCDLPSADELVAEIFRDFFTLIKRDLPKKVELFMADIMAALIEECQTLPSDVMDIIMAQFTDKNARPENPSFRLAVQVCAATADKLQRNVCQYFNDIITNNSGEEDYNEIRNAHDLIKVLHRACPAVLHSVIPQLEEELRAEDLTVRLLATQILGEMYSDKGGPDLVRKYPNTWNVWLSRKNDRAVPIRLKVVESCRGLIQSLPESREVVEGLLSKKLIDPDEKVRAAVCKLYSQLDYESALHYVSESQLKAVAGRGLDKKHVVRVEALNSIGRLYSLAYPEIENNDPIVIRKFAWIPEELLKTTAASPEVRSVVEQVLGDHILPLPSGSSSTKATEVDEVAWSDRLVGMMRYLSEKSINSLLGLSGLKAVRPNVYDVFIDSCIKYNANENEELVTRRLTATSQHLAASFPDPHKANEDFTAFAKLNENRLFKLAKICMDPQSDLKSLVKSTNEFNRRLEQLSSTLLPTLNIFLRRASYRILNQSSIPSLLKRVAKSYGSTAGHLIQASNHARILLTFVSKYSPALYKPHVAELVKAISDEKNIQLAEVGLQALAGLVKYDGSLAPTERRTNEKLEKYALHTNWRLAKFATRYLALCKNKNEVCKRLVDSIADALSSGESTDFDGISARVAALAQIAKYHSEAFERRSSVLMPFLLKKILMIPSEGDPEEMEDGEEWMEKDDIPEFLRAKIQALKVCRNRCLAHSTAEKALEIATPSLKMFATLLEHNGSLNPDVIEDPKFLSRMRLQAAFALLHLSTVEFFATAIVPKFLRLAVVIQDSCYNVRIEFLTKLVTFLQPRKLPPRYNVIPFLTVHDPEDDVKSLAASYVNGAKQKMALAVRIEHLDSIFIRLLHLLAHHPDFSTAHDDLLDIAKYVQFYLDLMASQDNISLLNHLAMKLKTVRDAETHGHTERLYIMSELAQELIKTRANNQSWVVPTYPGKVKLPADILRPLPNAESAKEIVKTVYLPEETRSWLGELSKTALGKEKKERKAPVKRKASSSKGSNTNNDSFRRRRKRAKSENDDGDEGEESAGETSEAEGSGDEMDVDKPPSSPEDRPRGTRISARNLAKV